MSADPLSLHLPMYCKNCGASLTYTEASWKCNGCGKEGTYDCDVIEFIWEDETEQSSTDIEESVQFDSGIPIILPPPPPRPSSFSDDLEDAPMIDEEEYERIRIEHLEQLKQNKALTRQIEAEGIVAIVRSAHFPLFALSNIRERFPFLSYGFRSEVAAGEATQLVGTFNLGYEGPNHPKNTERITINQKSKEGKSAFILIAGEFKLLYTDYVISFLAGLTGSEDPSMLALWQGKAIYQYINREVMRRTPAVSISIKAQSGEVVSWGVWRFEAPLPLIYAVAQIDNTMIEIGAIGPAADEIENLLGQLARLTPGSAILDQTDQSVRAWAEHLKHYYRTSFDQK